MMVDNIVNKILGGKTNCTSEYVDSIYRQVETYIDYSALPLRYLVEGIDTHKDTLPKFNNLSEHIIDIIHHNKSCLAWVNDFGQSGYIAANFIAKYLVTAMITDEHPKSILYVDTNLLLEDYKKLMNESYSEFSPKIVHRKEILYRDIQEADFVFWDKFNFIETNFETNKIYEIISVRYRNCLGNLFFGKGATEKELFGNIDVEMLNVMAVQKCMCDLRNETYPIVEWEESQ